MRGLLVPFALLSALIAALLLALSLDKIMDPDTTIRSARVEGSAPPSSPTPTPAEPQPEPAVEQPRTENALPAPQQSPAEELRLPEPKLAIPLPEEPAKNHFVVGLPVDCTPGQDCFIQNYVDMQPGKEARDYLCNSLSYNGHKGTDIRVPTLVEMREGVDVIAAADGSVRATRDGEPDMLVTQRGLAAVTGKEAGNAVVITHKDGWETQYSHLKLGSVMVKPGQVVKKGERLGLIGLSGKTEFPHLHFTVRDPAKRSLDPFTGKAVETGCGTVLTEGLWDEATRAQLSYQAGGLLAQGFSKERPDTEDAIAGVYRNHLIDPSTRSFFYWTVSWGLRQGDVEELTLLSPSGEILAQHSNTIPGDKARWMSFIGLPRPASSWERGIYTGFITLYRDGQIYFQDETDFKLN